LLIVLHDKTYCFPSVTTSFGNGVGRTEQYPVRPEEHAREFVCEQRGFTGELFVDEDEVHLEDFVSTLQNRQVQVTFIPVLQNREKKYPLGKPIEVADAGLLSDKNRRVLESSGYTYMLGARVKNSTTKSGTDLIRVALSLQL
jgi:hypothetical protein